MCVQALERHGLVPGDGPVLVTGATGGVGSIAVALLARAGFEVVAVTGKAAEAAYLKGLGAAAVLDRGELAVPGKILQKERYAGVVDTLGSHALANACAQVKHSGAVAACGLAMAWISRQRGAFILRGIALYGIDSCMQPSRAARPPGADLPTLSTRPCWAPSRGKSAWPKPFPPPRPCSRARWSDAIWSM